MISKPAANLQTILLTVVIIAVYSACKSAPTTRGAPASTAMHITDWREVAATDPMGDTENIRVTWLEKTPTASHHLVRIRKEEPLHKHNRSDLTVFILQGAGMMEIGESIRHCSTGDVIFVPRTAPHRFVNYSEDIAVAYIVFSPPFDGRDFVPAND